MLPATRSRLNGLLLSSQFLKEHARAVAPLLAAATVGIVVLRLIDSLAVPHLAGHMVWHIVLAGPIALLVAVAVTGERRHRPRLAAGGPALVAATIAQLSILWTLHAPPVHAAIGASPVPSTALQAALLAAACWFWLTAIEQPSTQRWRTLLALLITGKLMCLLGVLLIFAPRFLYPELLHSTHVSGLADQQLAGFFMIVGCPLIYVVAAVVIAARWLNEIDRAPVADGDAGQL